MGKRHSSDNEEQIRRKIAKLQKKLETKSRRRRIISESSSSEDEMHSIVTNADVHVASPSTLSRASAQETPELTTAVADVVSSDTVGIVDPVPEKELEADILELLGDAPKTDVVLGPAVHKDLATRWQNILLKGLPKETKESLINGYPIPSNCDLLLAPELNPEVKAALSEAPSKRDSALYSKQKQIGNALAALAVTMDKIIKEDTKQSILKSLSDASRILCDSHFSETRTRRNFVVTAVNTTLKDTLLHAPRDKYLFGDNVTDKLKAAKTIQRSGEALKAPSPPRNPFNKAIFLRKNNTNAQRGRLASRGDQRPVRGNYYQRGAYQQRPTGRSSRPPPRAHSPARRRDRTPPPPPRRSTRR